MPDLQQKLCRWLESHDKKLDRFRAPIPLSVVADEIGEGPGKIKACLRTELAEPPYHVWEHTHKGRTSRSKPFCLRLAGSDTVGLDWEDSVVGAAEAEFNRLGYQTIREVGRDEHISALIRTPDLSMLSPGVNLRDLWALRREGAVVELFIIEAKGKEAWPFDYYSFAEALSQVFPVPAELLSALLGAARRAGHGLCLKFAKRLYDAWRLHGYLPTITVAVLVPEWVPDVVWIDSRTKRISDCYYARPLSTFRQFLATGKTDSKSGAHKYQREFGKILDEVEKSSEIRSLACASSGIRFRLLTTRRNGKSREFELSGV
jgi:hypothetical protein